MARKRNSNFEPPTEADFTKYGPDRVRPGPRGGYLWLCEIDGCKVAASHLAASSGRKVCHRHGGSTAKQRDPVAHAEAVLAGEKPPMPPGRPIKNGGFYSIIPGHKVDELVQQYIESQMDPDATDHDMYYLRAYLDELKSMRPDGMEAAELLKAALEEIRVFNRSKSDEVGPLSGKPLTVSQILSMEGLLDNLVANTEQLRGTLKSLLQLTGAMEERHERLVMLSKVRSETRLKNAAGQQMQAFTVMVDRLMQILTEMLPSDRMEALQTRLARELEELPGAVKVVKA